MSTATDKYTVEWCRKNPDKAHLLIQHYEMCWGDASQACNSVTQERDALEAQVENWKDSAYQFGRNADFYRGIVCQIGEIFGEEARTSDDGSVQDDVLALKVPELVEALAAHVERLRRAALDAISFVPGGEVKARLRDAYDEEPTTSLARLKAEWCEDHAERFMELADNARTNGYMAQADAVEDMAQELKDEAAELRRQAEGGE